jgi:hypothetical protein
MPKSLLVLAAISWSPVSAAVVKLINNDYKEKTDGKTVFIKAFAPWVSDAEGITVAAMSKSSLSAVAPPE